MIVPQIPPFFGIDGWPAERSRLRILLVVLNFSPEPTGVGKYTGEMAKSLVAQGHEVRVICAPPYYPWWKVQPGYKAFLYKRESIDGAEVLRCPLYVPRVPTGLSRLFHVASLGLTYLPAIFWGARFRPDVVFTVQPSLVTSFPALIISFLTKATHWHHVQDLEIAAANKLKLLPGGLRRFAGAIEKWIYSRAEGISTISTSMASQLIERGSPRLPRVFPNWVDVDKIRPMESSPYRQELGIADDDFVALYSGNMGGKQGLDIIVKAAKALQKYPKIKFILAGEGSTRPMLEEMAKGLSNVRFLPLQPSERMSEFLALGDVHLVPQKAGVADLVMPSKMTAILSAGRPSIVTAMPEDELAIIGDQCGVSVLPGDVAGFANAIRSLATDPDACRTLGRNARKYAQDNLDARKILGEMEGFARNLAGMPVPVEAVASKREPQESMEQGAQVAMRSEKRLSLTGTAGLP